VFYALAIVTHGVALPTGLFVPSILCGAAYGRLVGVFVADTHPGQRIDEGTYALLGAASFLGGSMRMTMCTCVPLTAPPRWLNGGLGERAGGGGCCRCRPTLSSPSSPLSQPSPP